MSPEWLFMVDSPPTIPQGEGGGEKRFLSDPGPDHPAWNTQSFPGAASNNALV
jgi:hypothetical protein